MEEAYKILAVDDEQINREILSSSLEPHYVIRCVANGKECLETLDNWTPDIILMDVNLPGMNGLETCKLIKTHPQLNELPVIFISDQLSPDERLAGYNAGGIDYISKPFVPNELIVKINLSLSHKHKINIAQEKTQIIKLTARTAVDAAVEASHVLRFLQNCIASNSLIELIDYLFQAISEYQIHAVVEYRNNTEQFTQSSTGNVNLLEVDLLHKMKNKSGVFRFGKRAVYNRKFISLLILDLPEENNYKCDRVLDNMELIVDAASYAIKKLLNNENQQQKIDNLNTLILATTESLVQLQVYQQENISDHSTMIATLLSQVTEALAEFGLKSDHEQQLLNIIANRLEDQLPNRNTNIVIADKLNYILSQQKSAT